MSKRHVNELKAMISSINTETKGGLLLVERSERIHGAVGFSYNYLIKQWDWSEAGQHKILLDWSGFGEAHGFLKAMVLSLDIQGDILIDPKQSEEKINSAIDRSTAFLKEKIKALEMEKEGLELKLGGRDYKNELELKQCIAELEDKLTDRECKTAKDAHTICILQCEAASRDDRIRELDMQNEACSLHLRNLHDLRAELAVKDMTVKDLQRKINMLEIEVSDCNAAITNLKHELIANPKIGEVSVPTRLAIIAELRRA